MSKSIEEEVAGITPGGLMLPTQNRAGAGLPITSVLTGEPDTGAQFDISGFAYACLPFIMNRAGTVTDINVICQGNSGGGTARDVAYDICSMKPTNNTTTGWSIDEILLHGTTTIDDNASGDVSVATGLTVEVPKRFVVCIKAEFQTLAANKINIQASKNPGTFPGLFASVSGGVVYGAPTWLGAADTSDPPIAQSAGQSLSTSSISAMVMYVKWK